MAGKLLQSSGLLENRPQQFVSPCDTVSLAFLECMCVSACLVWVCDSLSVSLCVLILLEVPKVHALVCVVIAAFVHLLISNAKSRCVGYMFA